MAAVNPGTYLLLRVLIWAHSFHDFQGLGPVIRAQKTKICSWDFQEDPKQSGRCQAPRVLCMFAIKIYP